MSQCIHFYPPFLSHLLSLYTTVLPLHSPSHFWKAASSRTVLDCLFLPFLTPYPHTSLNFASRKTKKLVVHDGNLQRERGWRKVKEPRLQSRKSGNTCLIMTFSMSHMPLRVCISIRQLGPETASTHQISVLLFFLDFELEDISQPP